MRREREREKEARENLWSSMVRVEEREKEKVRQENIKGCRIFGLDYMYTCIIIIMLYLYICGSHR